MAERSPVLSRAQADELGFGPSHPQHPDHEALRSGDDISADAGQYEPVVSADRDTNVQRLVRSARLGASATAPYRGVVDLSIAGDVL